MNGFILACATLLSAHALPKPIQNMTCANAVRYVEKHHAYWTETYDGPVAIYPVSPLSHVPSCLPFEVFTYMQVATLDEAHCLVGYVCSQR